MIYTQQANLPIIFQVDEGIILKVDEFLKRNKLFFTKPLVVSGQSFSLKHARKLVSKNTWDNFIIEDNSIKEVERLKAYVDINNIDLIIGVGGGKVIDTVKRVSYKVNINNLSIPTILSNDGLISPIAVIKNELGKTDSLPGMMPLGVIIDLDIVKDSPKSFLKAAVGDVFSNISATNDWVIAFKSDREKMNDISFHLSKSAANALVHFEHYNLKSKSFLRILVQGLVNSGISMSLAGTSRPCSGSEHLISHAIDYLEISNGVLHGTQVASISLFTLFLQNKLNEEYLRFARIAEIPLDFTNLLNINDDDSMIILFNKSKEMRPGRETVLNILTEKDFILKLKSFKKNLQIFLKSKC